MALKDDVRVGVLTRLQAFGVNVEDPTTFVDEVEQAIMNYCNITAVPIELKFVWMSMVVDYLRWMDSLKPSPSGNVAPTALSSIREGDTTLGFSVNASGNAHNLQGVLDQVVMNYQDQLNRFRKVVWWR